MQINALMSNIYVVVEMKNHSYNLNAIIPCIIKLYEIQSKVTTSKTKIYFS